MKEELEDILSFQPQSYFLSSDNRVIVYVDVSSISIADFCKSDKPICNYQDLSNQNAPINDITQQMFENT